MINVLLALCGAHRVFVTYKQDELANHTQMGKHSHTCALCSLEMQSLVRTAAKSQPYAVSTANVT